MPVILTVPAEGLHAYKTWWAPRSSRDVVVIKGHKAPADNDGFFYPVVRGGVWCFSV